MERLKSMKESLMTLVQGQLAHTDCVDTKELGEAVDMIKDLAEAIYYCTVTKAMEETEEKNKMPMQNTYYYTSPRDMDWGTGRMNYGGTRPMYYTQTGLPQEMGRDSREGRSPLVRKMYMESKEAHMGKADVQELEHYLKELSHDLTEIIEQATPEEKAILQQKLSTLVSKI